MAFYPTTYSTKFAAELKTMRVWDKWYTWNNHFGQFDNTVPSSLNKASYTVGIKRQIWQNMKRYTIPNEIRVSLFSVDILSRFLSCNGVGDLRPIEDAGISRNEMCVGVEYSLLNLGWMESVSIASTPFVLILFSVEL